MMGYTLGVVARRRGPIVAEAVERGVRLAWGHIHLVVERCTGRLAEPWADTLREGRQRPQALVLVLPQHSPDKRLPEAGWGGGVGFRMCLQTGLKLE